VAHVDRVVVCRIVGPIVGPVVVGHGAYAKNAHASSASTTTIAAPTNT
jgi:hypothetical protein